MKFPSQLNQMLYTPSQIEIDIETERAEILFDVYLQHRGKINKYNE